MSFYLEWICYIFPIFSVSALHLLGTVIPMLDAVTQVVPVERLAVHFHDTYGQALSNILVSLQVRSPFSACIEKFFHMLAYFYHIMRNLFVV